MSDSGSKKGDINEHVADRGDDEPGDVEKAESPVSNRKRTVDMAGDIASLRSASPQSQARSPTNSDSPVKNITPRGGNEPFVIHVNQRQQNRGLFGMTRKKTFLVCGTGLCLAGGLAYFLLQWLEIPGLTDQIDRLEKEVDRLSSENDRYQDLNNRLNSSVRELQNITDSLNATRNQLEHINGELEGRVDDLEEQNNNFAEQNDQLESTVEDLLAVTTFLNETALAGLNQTLDQVSGILANQISVNQVISLRTLEYTYIQRVDSWTCDYNTLHAGEPYIQDFNSVIADSDFDAIMVNFGNLVLDELCLNHEDFKRFAKQQQYQPLTSTKLATSIKLYTTQALDWYFPESGENGLTHKQWAEASFKCSNLDPSLEYKFETSV